MKKITILGSTGSIGTSALKVITRFPGLFSVTALAAGSNNRLLSEQIRVFSPGIVGIQDKDVYRVLRSEFPSLKIVAGDEGIREVASYHDSDFVLSAIAGSAGLMPTIEAIKTGKTVGLANKESLVMAGDYVNALAEEHGTEIIPVDSEHSAIYQCINGRDRESVKSLVLTASGGPFIDKSKEDLDSVTRKEALDHPNWSMGRKISIDSSTLMNKGLEVIEAYHLFGIVAGNIKVLIHPQSIVHSMVEFIDGGIIAQLSSPDMSGPIAYALSYPERLPGVMSDCRLGDIGTLSFREPDTSKFPCLRLAYDALGAGGTMPAVLNAANEIAVNAFLMEKIKYNAIPVIIEKVMSEHRPVDVPELSDILYFDRWTRAKTEEVIRENLK
ncbi:1-deoxy-D-xylulose 5-phosphate reductoisomerase [bacterium BMS3Abin07]|nr:1-deoxy-D-xylulose 5-phosphate reductoisomerase [bacterium BMS3Abin07]GBE32566.1 1-deoxy-D-xylulose 5-phosphate reductoisomerase [bacterium BMS3Bbin05]HDO22900.1 1-deoxy-D-xylulose-5-phosphate reductoisomerase [Nitrospirota bacterium]HDZ89012.1 1-deoxy-D-xylulose-5-phosphate reductoisomerase [Nitrospirota bacterium]